MQLIGEALTFDDVSLVPAYSKVLPNDVSLQTRLSRDIMINAPLISAAMAWDMAGVDPLSFSQVITSDGAVTGGSGRISSRTPLASTQAAWA